VREHKLSMLLTSRPGAGRPRRGPARPALAPARAAARHHLAAGRGLLKAVLVKHFADRQLNVEPHVINYVALHMEQSMEAARRHRRGDRQAGYGPRIAR
jgi:hypothetical protein